MLLQVSARSGHLGNAKPRGGNGGGCQVAERDCRNRSLWVNLWVRPPAGRHNRGVSPSRFWTAGITRLSTLYLSEQCCPFARFLDPSELIAVVPKMHG